MIPPSLCRASRLGRGLRATFLVLLGIFPPLPAASGQIFARGARLGGMSAVVTYSDSATLENPALAGSSKRRTLGTWAVRMYGLRELQVFGIAGRVATGRLGAGARIISFGFDRYAEERLEFHAGGRIGPATEVTGPGYAAGAGLTLERRSNASGGARLTWKGRAGMILPLSSSWVLGTVVSKPLGSGGDGEPERAGSILIGGATQVAEYVRLAFDLYFEPPFKPSERGGFEILLAPPLLLRGGFSTSPTLLSLGVSFLIRPMSVHLAFERHDLLGWTTAVEADVDL